MGKQGKKLAKKIHIFYIERELSLKNKKYSHISDGRILTSKNSLNGLVGQVMNKR